MKPTTVTLAPTLLLAACSAPGAPLSDLEPLQGHWEGSGPPGPVTIVIDGDTLHYTARPEDHPEYWCEATFTLYGDASPQELHATIRESSSPGDVGQTVIALVALDEGVLTLAVDGGGSPPSSVDNASSRYDVRRTDGS